MSLKVALVLLFSLFVAFGIQMLSTVYKEESYFIGFSIVYIIIYMFFSNVFFCYVFNIRIKGQVAKLFSPSYTRREELRTFYLYLLLFILYSGGYIDNFVIPAMALTVSELYYYIRNLKN